MDAQGQYADVANQATGAFQTYSQGLMELLLQLAAMQTAQPSTTLSTAPRRQNRPRRNGPRGNR